MEPLRDKFLQAAKNGDLDEIKECIKRGVNVDVVDGDGLSALHDAAFHGHLEIVKYLIQDCHVNVTTTKDNNGLTALHSAARFGHLEIVKYLIQDCHVDVTTTKDNDGETALHYAAGYGHLEIVKYLIQDCHVDVTTTKDNDGRTALHYAARDGHLEIVKYLVEECSADMTVTTKSGQTAYQIAREHEKFHVADYLSNHKAVTTSTPTHPINNPANNKSDSEILKDRKNLESLLNDPIANPVCFSVKYLELCTDNFTSRVLGSGGFGTVYFGCDKVLGVQIAVKRSYLEIPNQETLDFFTSTFKKEIAVLKRFKHPNIVVMYGYNVSLRQGSQYLVYEYLANGSLADFLKDEKGRTRLSSAVRLSIMYQVARAVHFLHTGGCDNFKIFHRDIKSGNICLTQNYTAKLIDCGLAKFVPIDKSETLQGSITRSAMKESGLLVFGTADYICPVYSRGKSQYKASFEVYSIGVVLVELLVGSLQGGQSSQNGKDFGDFFHRYIKDEEDETIVDGWKIMKEDADSLAEWNDKTLDALCQVSVNCMASVPKHRMTTLSLVEKLGAISNEENTIRSDNANESVTYDSLNDHNELTTDNTIKSYVNCALCNRSVCDHIACVDGHKTCIQCIEEDIRSHMGQSGDGFCCRCGSRIHDDNLYGKISNSTYTNYINARSNRKSLNDQFDIIIQRLDAIYTMTEENHKLVMIKLKGIESNVQRLLGGLAFLATNSVKECPTLVWIVPSEPIHGRSVAALKRWAVNLTNKTFDLYFVCQDSLEVIDIKMTINIQRRWIEKVAPMLYLGMFVLKAALTMSGLPLPSLPFPFPDVSRGEQIQMYQEFMADFLDDATKTLLATFQNSCTNRSDITFSESSQLQALTGPAYDEIASRAMKMKRCLFWKDRMVPVPNNQGSIIWVKKEYRDKYMANWTASA